MIQSLKDPLEDDFCSFFLMASRLRSYENGKIEKTIVLLRERMKGLFEEIETVEFLIKFNPE